MRVSAGFETASESYDYSWCAPFGALATAFTEEIGFGMLLGLA